MCTKYIFVTHHTFVTQQNDRVSKSFMNNGYKTSMNVNIQFSTLFSQRAAFFSKFDVFIMLFPGKHFYKVVL